MAPTTKSRKQRSWEKRKNKNKKKSLFTAITIIIFFHFSFSFTQLRKRLQSRWFYWAFEKLFPREQKRKLTKQQLHKATILQHIYIYIYYIDHITTTTEPKPPFSFSASFIVVNSSPLFPFLLISLSLHYYHIYIFPPSYIFPNLSSLLQEVTWTCCFLWE